MGIWIDEPTKSGKYWVSPFVDGRYISPYMMDAIDYDRPGRGIEVCHGRDTIPAKVFCEEYYPKAKWMFIEMPDWQELNKLEVSNGR